MCDVQSDVWFAYKCERRIVMYEGGLFEERKIGNDYADPIAGMRVNEKKQSFFGGGISNWVYIAMVPLLGPIGTIMVSSGLYGSLALFQLKLPLALKILLTVVIAGFVLIWLSVFVLFSAVVLMEV